MSSFTPGSDRDVDAAASTVAALYVEKDGAYFGLPGVDPWDEERDALAYDGPFAVVAHPPCRHWSLMGQCRGYKPTDIDYQMFGHALACVEKFGGALEHPAHSKAWKAFDIGEPNENAGWKRSFFRPGWTCEVDQRWYGHDANKPTWLYYVGPDPPALISGRAPRGERTVGRGWGGGREHLRSRTPDMFRDVLLDMARSARIEVAA